MPISLLGCWLIIQVAKNLKEQPEKALGNNGTKIWKTI